MLKVAFCDDDLSILNEITVFGQIINFGAWSYPITLLFILGCVNIINLIDGLDGLSSGITSIFLTTMGAIAFIQGRQGTLEITLIFIMLGSVLGFLLHNFNPAKIFAGDTGSIPGSGSSLGEGHVNPIQYPCLGIPMDREVWWATVHEVTKSQT